MKTYKYYVHGKPKTFDLSSLTPEEIEKFKNMNNIERLRFIELHHLENIPLWEQIDLKTSTKLSDEGETDRKNKQKYSELFRAKNIKNQLEQMKDKGTEPTEENIKKVFNDFETQDIKQAIKNGYADIDSLINFYANKIETLNVDSIDTLKAKEIKNLEAANIKLNDTKSLAKAIEKVFPKEYVKKIVEGIEKGDIPESVGVSVVGDDVLGAISGLMASGNNVLADDIKNYFEDLVKKVEAKTGSSITKEDLNSILKTDDLKKELIKEIKEAKEEIKTDIGESAEYLKEEIKDYQTMIENLNKLQKEGLKYNDMLESVKNILIKTCNGYGWNKGKRNETGYRDSNYIYYTTGKEEDDKIDYPTKEINKDNLKKALIMLVNYENLPKYEAKGNIEQRAEIQYYVLENLYKILSNYDEFNKMIKKEDKEEVKEGKGESSYGAMGQSPCGGKFLNRFKDFEPDIKRLERMINEKHTELKDELKNDIKNIYLELKELKQIKTEPKVIKEEMKEEHKDSKPSYNFLNDISKPKNLKPVKDWNNEQPTEIKIYEPEEEYKDLKDILRRRREDIEPDETDEEDDEDWGEGIKHSKVIKFKELLKMLK